MGSAGGYAVYAGSDASGSVTVTGLTPSREGATSSYDVYVYTYAKGSDDATANYLTSSCGSKLDVEMLTSQGPTLNVTGVDTNGFVVNWNSLGEGASYQVNVGKDPTFAGNLWSPLEENFQNWTTGTSGTQSTPVFKNGIAYTWKTAKVTHDFNSSSSLRMVWLDTQYGYFQMETPTAGRVTKVTYTLRAASSDNWSSRTVQLIAVYPNGDLEVLKESYPDAAGDRSQTYTASVPLTPGVKLRWYLKGGSGALVDNIHVEMTSSGHQSVVSGLEDDTQFYAQVYKLPDGDATDVQVKTGVLPGAVTQSTTTPATRDSVTFEWGAADTGVTGYIVDATTVDAADWEKECTPASLSGNDAKSLYTNEFKTGRDWMYIGTTVGNPASGSAGSVTRAPLYSDAGADGQFLVGKAGLGIESKAFDIAGATNMVFSYTVYAWNLAQSGANREMGRVDAYYKLDSGPWNFLGTGVPPSTSDNSYTNQYFVLGPGQLDGGTVTFKIVAPNAAKAGNYLAGPYVQALKVVAHTGEGNYNSHVSATYPKTISGTGTLSETVTGLAPNTTVHFRVQALQGTSVKSIWVEGDGSSGGFPGPTLLAADPVERYGFTANWTADAAATGGYQIEWTRCGGGAADTTVSTCANGSLTAGGDSGWRYIRPAGSGYPKWAKGSANQTVGHNMLVGVSPANPSPAVASPDMDFSGFTGGYVEFSHWSRHATLIAPDAQVTLWYRTSADGSSWGAWTEGTTTANLTSGGTIVTEQLPIPAGAAGQAHVQIKLSTEHSLPSGGGNASIVVDGDSTYTGPIIKDVVVHGTSSGTPDYDTCAEGRSGTINVAAGTTLKAFTGLAAGTPYYYHVRSVAAGPVYSAWSEGQVTTLAPMGPPDEVWAENVRQKHMTVAWSEAEGADENTLYKYQVSGCSPSATPTVVAVSESPTNMELTVDAEWSYIGGGTLVGAETVSVGGSTLNKASEETYVESAKESYPVWAGNKGGSQPEHSLVLAGLNSPGLESAEFSTVGASAGQLSFGHGRWYAQESGSGAATVLTLYYSIDGGDSWTQFATAGNVYDKSYAYNNVVTHNLPDAAMGHAHVKVRLVAEAATVGKATTSATTYHALGAAVTAAKVTLTKPTGNYTGSGCVVASGEGLTHDQLSAELSGLTPGATYYFRVSASDGETSPAQYGAWVESMAKTLAVPGAPASAWVVQSSIGRHAMTVQWDEAAGAESYVLRVYSNSGRTTQVGSDHPVSGTTYTVTGLSASTHYYFSVQSIADGCESSGVATCDDSTSATLAVTGFCVTNILDTSLSVKWDNVADTAYTLQVGTMETTGTSEPLYETIECPATTLARSDAGNGWFYLGGNANYPKYYVNSDSAKKAEDQGHVLSYISGGTPGIQSRWFSTFGAKSATVEFLHGRWYNNGANSALRVYYSIDGGTTWTSAGDIPSVAGNTVPGGTLGGEKTVTRLALPARALGQRMVAIRLVAPSAAAGGSYGYGAEIKDLKIKIEAHPNAANVFSGTVSGGIKNLTGLTVGQRYWFKLTASETYGGSTYTAEATQTAATRQKTTGVVQSQGFEGPSANGALDTTAWGYQIKYFTVGNSAADAVAKAWATGYPVVEVVDGENPLYGDRALRMSGSSAASVYGVVEFLDKNFGSAQNVAVTIPFAVRDLASGENLWVCYSTDDGNTWSAPTGLDTLTKSGMTLGKIARGGSDTINQNWPYNHGLNETTRPGGDAYTFEVRGASRIAVRVVFCGNSGGAKHYCYIDEVKLERLATPPSAVSATANAQGSVNLGWTPAGGQSVVIIRGQDQRNPPASVDLGSLPKGYEVVTNATGGTYWVNTADPASAATGVDSQVTGGWKYFYYFYGALANGDGTYTLSKECVSAEAIVKGMVEAIASQGWDGWDVHPWGYKKGRTTNPGQAGDCGYWAYNQSGATLPYKWAHFEEDSWEYDGDARGNQGAHDYAYYYGAGKTYGPAGRTDPDSTQQLGVSSYTNYFGTNCFRLSGGSGWVWSGPHTYTNNNNNVRTVTDPYINTNNAAIQFDTVDLSGYKNVQFSFHYAQTYSGGGNYMHVAISTNGNGENGSWLAYDNKNDAGWRQVDASRDYGLQLQTMTEKQTGGNVDFYDESRAPYGNPFVLNVPDSVTQMTVRLTFFDTAGFDQRKALVFVDEVRLTGEVAIEAPKPYISEIGKDRFMVHWVPVTDATSYDVQVTEVCDESVIKLAQAFPVNALPKDWTKSDTGVNFPKTASRLYSGATGDHDHGLSLTGQGGWLTSPEVGGSTNLHFWAKANNGSGSSKLIVQAKGADEPESAWETLLTKTCAQLTATWTEYELALPNRQWTQVRFMRSTDGTGDIYVDDVEFHGEGVYTGTVKLDVTGVAATNQVVTGLESGHRYLAHVRAVGAPAGVVVRSAWGETADWTSGDFKVVPDGFEMTRSTWAAASGGMVVIAVDKGTDPGAVKAPTNTLAGYQTLAGTYGAFDDGRSTGAHVIWAGTAAQSAPGKEFVSPYDEDHPAADFVVYWKRGSYWEGRLATNVALGTYMCAAADAFAVTNATALTAGAQGAGWDGNWQAWEDGSSYISVIDGSLIGSNKLAGAGGNMVRFTMEDGARYLRVYRPLETALSSSEVWIMATFRSRYGMDPSNPNEAKTLAVQLSDAKDNPSGGVHAGDSTHVFAQFGRLADTDRHMKIWNNAGNTASSYTLDDWGHGSGSGIYTMVAKYTRGDGNLRVKVYYEGGTGTISGGDGELRPTATEPGNAAFDAVRNVGTHNVASIFLMGSGYHGYLDFDEVRVGTSWADIVGKETEAPFPVTAARAWTDGNELVRIDWTYANEGTDTSVTPNLERPLAAGVRVIAKTGTGAWTAEELALAAHPVGTTAGDAVVIYEGKGTNELAVAAGGISRWDHVVAPGSTHRYAVAAYTGGKNAAAVEAVDRDNAGVYVETTGLYGETEYVNPFAYTNWATWSSESGRRWTGGNGFGANYWSVPDGSAGTWSLATPEEAQSAVHITNGVHGSRMAAGNVMKVVVGDVETASIDRTLDGDAWYGKGGQTFYVAFRMAYQWDDKAGRQVGLRLTDDTGKYVQFGKARGDDSGYQHRFGVTASPNGTGYTSGWSTSGDDMNGYGNASGADYVNNAYLVVGKVNWSSDGKANLRGVKYLIGNNGSLATLPGEEKDVSWEASYDNAGIGAIRKIELIAGTEGSGNGTIGTAWFDEIRFGPTWEDIVGATEPQDTWVEGLGVETADATYRYLGDYVRWYMWGWPKGPKQSAWVTLATDTTFATVLATNGTSWVENTVDGRAPAGSEQTKWQGGEVQFTRTGYLYAGGSVKGELVTLNSWQRPAPHDVNGHKWNTYEVLRLPPPTVDSAVGGTARATLRWTPATENSRTFTEVMVVRYTGDGAAPAPVQGTTYLKGQSIGSGTVVYRGTATSLVDKGLTKSTTYHYLFFTVNNSYYSLAATANATTDENDPEIVIDGDPTDWVGEPSETKNSSTLSSGEWIWTDKVLDGRVDKNAAYDADITEFRMKVDNNGYVNFMARLHCMTNKQNPYISVGIVTNVDATQLAATGNEDGENWIGDESATFMGGNLFDPATLHYADIQMAVHWVTTAGEDGVASGSGGWVVELYKKDGNSWYAPAVAWEAESSDNGAADPCIEWKVKRSDLGLDYANVTPARFTVASFANGGGWNNDTEATVDLSSGKSHAVDTLCIAPWGVNDKDLALSAWDEGIKDGNAEYWFDIWFGPTALHNAAPNAPASYTLEGAAVANGQLVTASPWMGWSTCTDGPSEESSYRGFVVGYLVEVSTNEYFNGLEGTTENGPISCRVNVKSVDGAATMSYRYKTDSRYYWWRVRARDNSGALSAPTPWHYEVTGKTDNEGPVARLLFVGKNEEVTRYMNEPAFRHEADMSGDGTSVLDSDLEDGGHAFGFVLEWYDVNGVFATNWLRPWKSGDGEGVWPSSSIYPNSPWTARTGGRPNEYDFAWNIQSHHDDGTPYGRVSPNWDLVIVDRSTVSHEAPATTPAKPADEMVGGVAKSYTWTNAMVLPTDDGGTETIWGWVIDCGLDHVFQPAEMVNDGNDGQYITNHVLSAFSIGTYRTDLDIYLTVSAEDGCKSGPYAETADYDWPLYAENGSTGSYKSQGGQAGYQQSGFCGAAPNPSRNVTTNQLLHIHVRDNDTTPPVTSQAKWRADALSEAGTPLLPMMAVTVGGASTAPTGWDPTWANLEAQGRVPTQEGQGKALQWQLTDGDVATYTHPATAGGTGTTAWKGSAKPIRLFFNVYDEYLHSGLASFKTYDAGTPWNTSTWTAQDGMEGTYTSVADNPRTLRNTGLLLAGANDAVVTNWANYVPGWSKVTPYPWTEGGNNEHGLGTGLDSVLAWQLEASQANLEALLGQGDLLAASSIGTNAAGDQLVVTNPVKLYAFDNDNNAVGDQEGAELEFGQLLFSDDDATPPEMVGFTSAGTGTNYTHFGELAKWTWGTGYEDVTTNTLHYNRGFTNLSMSANVTGKQSSISSSPESDSDVTVYWHGGKSAIQLRGNMNADTYRAGNAKYFQFQMGGNGNTTWRADMIGFYSRVSPTGPTKFALTYQGRAGIGYPAVSGRAWVTTANAWSHENCSLAAGTVGYNAANSRDNVVILDPLTTGSGQTATLESPSINCLHLSGLKVEFSAGRSGGGVNDPVLKVEYSVDGGSWTELPSYTFIHKYEKWTTTANDAGKDDKKGWEDVQFDLFDEVAELAGRNKNVKIRFNATGLKTSSGAGTTKYGFRVADPKLTAMSSGATEELLGTLEVEKTISTGASTSDGDAAETVGSYANTETDVILGFDGQVEGYDDSLVTFRLYGYGATHLNANTGEIDTSDTANGTWAIKNLYIHGTASEPKHSEVTDYDVATGAWTNRLEALDGAMAGYDTVRSGLRVKDAAGEVSGEKPSFRILYPSYYDGTTHAIPNGDENGVVTTGDLVMKAVAEATFDTIGDPDFDTGTGWSPANGAVIDGGRLKLPDNSAISSASRELTPLTASSTPVESVTIAGTVRARGTKTLENGGVNTLTVEAQPYEGAATLGDPLVTNITANASWKNYAVGPWSIPGGTVTKVAFTVRQTGAESTEMLVEELRMHVAQWGSDITTEDDEWATTVVNGMPAAKILVGTPELNLRTTSMPLSTNHSGAATKPAAEWYTLEATLHDFDGDRPGDALHASATTNFWLYDDDELAPQYGSKYGGPLGVFLNGTIVPQAWRTGITEGQESSKLNQRWPITDAELTALAPADPVTFALSFYDYSGWYTKNLLLGEDAIVSARAIPSAASTRGWSAPAENDGEAEAPGATSTWSIGAKNLYTAYRTAFAGTEGSEKEVLAEVWDKDNDRADDDMSFNDDGAPKRVGYVWFTDSDIQAPQWGAQTEPYYGVMLSTNVPNSAAGYAAMLAQTAGNEPYAVGGLASNQTGNIAARTFTIYDGQLNALNAAGNDKAFVVTANLNDPLPGFRARKVSGLQRGATLTEKRAMWGDNPDSPSDAANAFTITNTYVVLTNAAEGTAVTNAAFNLTFSEAISKTRVAMQAGHTSWTWSSFPTNDIGLLLPSGASSAALTLMVEAYDSDMNRHNDQMHASLAGPAITLRDDDTQAPTRPEDVTLTGLTLPPAGEELTRLNAPWTNNLGGVKLGFTAATDTLGAAPDIKAAGVARYRLAAPTATPGVEIGSVVQEVSDQSVTSYSNLSVPSIAQGFGAYKLFAVDADADRPGDAMVGPAATVPLAFDETPPTPVPVNHGTGASTDDVDDPTTQMDLVWTATGVGPDDNRKSGGNYVNAKYGAIPPALRSGDGPDILSPWATYKVYYSTFNAEAAEAQSGNENNLTNYIYNTYLKVGATGDSLEQGRYTTWSFVTAENVPEDATATVPTGETTAYSSLGKKGTASVRLYDLDFDQDYIFVIVGVDKAGNEGEATSASWATNNTIKFAVTQGVVRATAAINKTLTDMTAAQRTHTEIQLPDMSANAPKQGAVLYWMASENKTTGLVNKEYDLIYRDAPSFTENGTERGWTTASSGSGAGANTGTSKANWNYQASDFSGIGRGNLRFFRASYAGRWNPPEGKLPLASEEVYSMNRVPLVEGRNLVALQGVPYTNTFAGVFGTDTNIFPAGRSGLTDATRVEFFGGQEGTSLNSSEAYYFVNNGGTPQWWQVNVTYADVELPTDVNPSKEKWFEVVDGKSVPTSDSSVASGKSYYIRGAVDLVEMDPSKPTDVNPKREGWFERSGTAGNYVYARSGDETWASGKTYYVRLKRTNLNTTTDPVDEDVTHFEQEDGFFSRGFEIIIPSLTNRTDVARNENSRWSEANSYVWHYGIDWYPILKVPTTNGVVVALSTNAAGHATVGGEELAPNTALGGRTMFSVDVQGGAGGGVDGRRYTLVSLNMPVAAHPRDMGLVMRDSAGNQTLKDQNGKPIGRFHAGNGFDSGDLIYIYDSETGGVRDNTVVFLDASATPPAWKVWRPGAAEAADVPEGFFKPNDVIIIVGMGDLVDGKPDDWKWVYNPSQFYKLPDRWMGRKRETPAPAAGGE